MDVPGDVWGAVTDASVLVTGATGNTSRPLVELLQRRGIPVRAMVRRAADGERFPPPLDAVVADFDDPAALTAALAGVERACLVTPSSARAQAQQQRFVDAAAEAGVVHLVKLSQLAADVASPVRFLRYHAGALTEPGHLGATYTITGPAASHTPRSPPPSPPSAATSRSSTCRPRRSPRACGACCPTGGSTGCSRTAPTAPAARPPTSCRPSRL